MPNGDNKPWWIKLLEALAKPGQAQVGPVAQLAPPPVDASAILGPLGRFFGGTGSQPRGVPPEAPAAEAPTPEPEPGEPIDVGARVRMGLLGRGVPELIPIIERLLPREGGINPKTGAAVIRMTQQDAAGEPGRAVQRLIELGYKLELRTGPGPIVVGPFQLSLSGGEGDNFWNAAKNNLPPDVRRLRTTWEKKIALVADLSRNVDWALDRISEAYKQNRAKGYWVAADIALKPWEPGPAAMQDVRRELANPASARPDIKLLSQYLAGKPTAWEAYVYEVSPTEKAGAPPLPFSSPEDLAQALEQSGRVREATMLRQRAATLASYLSPYLGFVGGLQAQRATSARGLIQSILQGETQLMPGRTNLPFFGPGEATEFLASWLGTKPMYLQGPQVPWLQSLLQTPRERLLQAALPEVDTETVARQALAIAPEMPVPGPEPTLQDILTAVTGLSTMGAETTEE